MAHISKCLSDCNVNIAFMKLFREEKGAQAYCIVESDERLPLEITDWITATRMYTIPCWFRYKEGWTWILRAGQSFWSSALSGE